MNSNVGTQLCLQIQYTPITQSVQCTLLYAGTAQSVYRYIVQCTPSITLSVQRKFYRYRSHAMSSVNTVSLQIVDTVQHYNIECSLCRYYNKKYRIDTVHHSIDNVKCTKTVVLQKQYTLENFKCKADDTPSTLYVYTINYRSYLLR